MTPPSPHTHDPSRFATCAPDSQIPCWMCTVESSATKKDLLVWRAPPEDTIARDTASLSNADTCTILRGYYFYHTCRILSGFDSHINPLREWVSKLSAQNDVVHSCVLAISAAHISQQERGTKTLALSYHTRALSSLAAGVAGLDGTLLGSTAADTERKSVACRNESLTALLFGIIVFGMTASWHDSSSLGIQHLKAARAIFQALYSYPGVSLAVYTSGQGVLHDSSIPRLSFRVHAAAAAATLQHFFVGALAYWEALTSFVVDQEDLEVAEYLLSPQLRVSHQAANRRMPNDTHPWSGISTELFICLSRVGAIARQLHYLRRNRPSCTAADGGGSTATQLHARHNALRLYTGRLKALVSQYRIPPPEAVRETGDALAPVDHFRTLARVYQLSALLELYRMFPELEQQDQSASRAWLPPHEVALEEKSEVDHWRRQLNARAMDILSLIASIPKTSSTRATQMLALVIAGSTLQPLPVNDGADLLSGRASGGGGGEYTPPSYATPTTTITTTQAEIRHWRTFVADRLQNLACYVGLTTVQQAARIVEQSWARADSQAAGGLVGNGARVMSQQNLVYSNGQAIRYKPVGGPNSNTSESVGTIKGVLTEPGMQADRNVDASEENPRYEVENQNTGKLTSIYEKNILGSA
ncbi:hypothetical protein BO99DRAFT_439501 [Aspergillus violaceofuscus CBS 115571]|uniref:Hypervirulence associated protein TUDOR domain-containing protein n=1 Tax=Aspergillus violaceofuscus (strain CBS 115571) TaxID=1450538 RepID=A0A2V5IJX7_ASPV1|nr:hypothetical protein BO99DRAFT_439501 [Aspergillus violaceofuscus CBS 115571]